MTSKETIELAFLAAIQRLPAGQRAVLILRDVLDWSAKDTAASLGMSRAAVNSSLATRARDAGRALFRWVAANGHRTRTPPNGRC